MYSQLQYKCPRIDFSWADSRNTHLAVATAIHAIADDTRSADDIWEAPTAAEMDHIHMAVENYLDCNVFSRDPDDRYSWGAESIIIIKAVQP